MDQSERTQQEVFEELLQARTHRFAQIARSSGEAVGRAARNPRCEHRIAEDGVDWWLARPRQFFPSMVLALGADLYGKWIGLRHGQARKMDSLAISDRDGGGAFLELASSP